jgi:hypothetical protein
MSQASTRARLVALTAADFETLALKRRELNRPGLLFDSMRPFRMPAKSVLVIRDDVILADMRGLAVNLDFPERAPAAPLLLDDFGMRLQELVHEYFEFGNVSFVHHASLVAGK